MYLEKIKCKLALKVDFNLRDLFHFLDSSNKGYVDHYDLEKLCKYLGVKIEGEESLLKDLIRMFIRQYDKDCDGKLLFTDIGKAFLS